MINFAVVLGLDAIDRICGVSEKTAQMIAESEAMNRESRDVMLNVAKSTDAITQQIAINGLLLAESMKNDNLRRLRDIQSERQRILYP